MGLHNKGGCFCWECGKERMVLCTFNHFKVPKGKALFTIMCFQINMWHFKKGKDKLFYLIIFKQSSEETKMNCLRAHSRQSSFIVNRELFFYCPKTHNRKHMKEPHCCTEWQAPWWTRPVSKKNTVTEKICWINMKKICTSVVHIKVMFTENDYSYLLN